VQPPRGAEAINKARARTRVMWCRRHVPRKLQDTLQSQTVIQQLFHKEDRDVLEDFPDYIQKAAAVALYTAPVSRCYLFRHCSKDFMERLVRVLTSLPLSLSLPLLLPTSVSLSPTASLPSPSVPARCRCYLFRNCSKEFMRAPSQESSLPFSHSVYTSLLLYHPAPLPLSPFSSLESARWPLPLPPALGRAVEYRGFLHYCSTSPSAATWLTLNGSVPLFAACALPWPLQCPVLEVELYLANETLASPVDAWDQDPASCSSAKW